MTDINKLKSFGKKKKLKIFPSYCDLNCKFAAFSSPETIGACMKEISIWCRYNKKYNLKHNKCISGN
jgi:hypothetical protein